METSQKLLIKGAVVLGMGILALSAPRKGAAAAAECNPGCFICVYEEDCNQPEAYINNCGTACPGPCTIEPTCTSSWQSCPEPWVGIKMYCVQDPT